MSDEKRIEEFVHFAKLVDGLDFDEDKPVVSNLFMGMALNSMRLELQADGLLEAATDRLADAGTEVREAGEGGEHTDPGHGEGG